MGFDLTKLTDDDLEFLILLAREEKRTRKMKAEEYWINNRTLPEYMPDTCIECDHCIECFDEGRPNCGEDGDLCARTDGVMNCDICITGCK